MLWCMCKGSKQSRVAVWQITTAAKKTRSLRGNAKLLQSTCGKDKLGERQEKMYGQLIES